MIRGATGRVIWPLLWAAAATPLAIVLWQVVFALLPTRQWLGALAGALVVLAGLTWLPFLALRRSLHAQQTWGVIVGAFSLSWAVLVAASIAVLLALGSDPSEVLERIYGPRAA